MKNMIPNHEPPNNNPITLSPAKIYILSTGMQAFQGNMYIALCCSIAMTAFSKASIRNQHVAWSGLGKGKICTLYGSIDSLGKGTL